MVENHETISVDGDVLALVKLADVLELPQRSKGTARDNHSKARVRGHKSGPCLDPGFWRRNASPFRWMNYWPKKKCW